MTSRGDIASVAAILAGSEVRTVIELSFSGALTDVDELARQLVGDRPEPGGLPVEGAAVRPGGVRPCRSPPRPAGGRPPLAFFVPGRIEVLGKHTDYAGGRTMVAAVERGFCRRRLPRDDRQIVVIDAASGETIVFLRRPDLKPPAGSWSNYPMTVARRMAQELPGRYRGADIALLSDLPPAAGMSSSSALMIGVFLVLAEVNQLAARDEYWHNIGSNDSIWPATWARSRTGRVSARWQGDRGVGTFGGSEDHTAILCAEPNHISQYAYCPVEFEKMMPLPPGYVFAVGAQRRRGGKDRRGARKVQRRRTVWPRRLAELWRRRDRPRRSAPGGCAGQLAGRRRAVGRDAGSAGAAGINVHCSSRK